MNLINQRINLEMTSPIGTFNPHSLQSRTAVLWLSIIALACAACGPRKAPDSKRRTVDGHFARVISGQLPMHGSVYSNAETEIMRARLEQNPNNIPARQGLAEALARLNKFDAALSELDTLEATRPERFETLFLRADILAKQGKLEEAVAAARQALELRSSGHDETGPYFQQMYEWQLARKEGTALPINFLGISYGGGAAAVAASEDFNQQYLVGLLAIFPTFFDGHMTLGDWLTSQSNDQLAARAYLRALQLAANEEDKQRINKRLMALENSWQAKAASSPSLVYDSDYRSRIDQEFKAAADWQVEYELLEQELVRNLPEGPPLAPEDADEATQSQALKARRDAIAAIQLPDAEHVAQQMKLRNYTGPAYYHAGLVAAKPPPWQFLTGGSPYVWTIAGVAALGVFFFYRRIASERKRHRYKL